MDAIRNGLAVIVAVAFWSAAAAGGDDTGATGAAAEIRAVLEEQVAAWNRGDIPGYMAGFWNSEETRYVSGATVVMGWRSTLERYQRRYDTAEKRGVLSYSDYDIRVLSATHAFVFCTWHLERGEAAGGSVGGAVTKLFRNTAEGWKVVHNHVASN